MGEHWQGKKSNPLAIARYCTVTSELKNKNERKQNNGEMTNKTKREDKSSHIYCKGDNHNARAHERIFCFRPNGRHKMYEFVWGVGINMYLNFLFKKLSGYSPGGVNTRS